ncbi:MAG: glycosyltransferase family 9 protein [candidate division Zixibacteria bacterium]|nr:glycosyltransferase family 9 protein [candidate division Zixibacteria bacterium]
MMKLFLIKLLKLLFTEDYTVPDKVNKILVIRQDNRIGNMLFITPLIREIKRSFPQATLDLITAGKFSEIFDNNPHIDNLIEVHHKDNIMKPWILFEIISRIRKSQYDLVFDTKDVLSFNNALLAGLSYGKQIVGYNYEGSEHIHNVRIDIPPAEMYEPLRHLQLLYSLTDSKYDNDKMELFLRQEEVDNVSLHLKKVGFEPDSFIAIHCGGRGRKSYGVERFYNAAKTLVEKHNQKVLFIYGPDESEEAIKLKKSENIHTLLPKDVQFMTLLISQCRLFLSGDTGALHIAVALGKPTVSLFFGSYWARYAPKGDKHKVYYKLDEPPGEDSVVEMVVNQLSKTGKN